MAARRPSQTPKTEGLIAGQTYRVLSLWPPWAWAIMYAGKDVENRSFSTPYRGRLLIHASSKKISGPELESDRAELADRSGFSISDVPRDFTRSAILGSVELVDCVEDADSAWASPGMPNWIIRDPRALVRPIEGVKGAMKVWPWTPTQRDLAGQPPSDRTAPAQPSRKPSVPMSDRNAEPSSKPADAGRSIDDLDANEILCALRATASAAPANEVDLLRATSRRLGFARMGSRVEKALKAQVRAGVRRNVFAKDGNQIRAATRSVADYEVETLMWHLGSVVRRGQTLERRDAARLLGAYLGFGEPDATTLTAVERVLDQAIARGMLVAAGAGSVRRVA